MKVIRARHAGACYGVQRALDMAYATVLDGSLAYTLGPLIHNPQVVRSLDEQGVTVAQSLDEIEEGIIIFRSHGVSPDIKQAAQQKGLPIIDATCPHVARAQKAASNLAKENYRVVVVGESGHPEVEGMTAYAQEASDKEVIVVADSAELPDDISDPVGIVVQTTQAREKLDEVANALENKGLSPQVKNTICSATRQRQDAAAALAEEVDTIVIIGGRNSSNTTRLYDICVARCPNSHHIETPDEIDPDWFKGRDVVGVTAGASTPEEQIDAVIEYLEKL